MGRGIAPVKGNLILKSDGGQKLQVVKLIKVWLKIGLKQAKKLVDNAPSTLKQGISMTEAMDLKARIEAAGATVTIRQQ